MTPLLEGVTAIGGEPAGWKIDRETGEYKLELDRIDPGGKRARDRGRAAAAEAARALGVVSGFGQQQNRGNVKGHLRGAEVQAERWAGHYYRVMAANPELMRQGCREVVDVALVRVNNRPWVRTRCVVTGVEALVQAGTVASGKMPGCRECGKKVGVETRRAKLAARKAAT